MNGRFKRQRLATLGLALILTLFWIGLTAGMYAGGMTTDFLSFYIGFRLASNGAYAKMYDPQVQTQIQRQVDPAPLPLRVYTRPPYLAAAGSVLSRFPLRIAYLYWIAFQAILFLACIGWAWNRFGDDALIWCAMCMPAFVGLACGQDSSLMLAMAVAGFSLAERDRDLESGLVWGLGLVKFNLVIPLVVALFIVRRWRILAGFSLTGAALSVWSISVLGIEGIRLYAELLQSKEFAALNPSPHLMINLQGMAANFQAMDNLWILVPATIGILVLSWLAIRNAPLWRWTSAAIMTCLLVGRHVYIYNGAILLLPVCLCYFCSGDRWTRIAAAIYGVPLLYYFRLFEPGGPAVTPLSIILLLAALAREGVTQSRNQVASVAQGA